MGSASARLGWFWRRGSEMIKGVGISVVVVERVSIDRTWITPEKRGS